ncbi:MULTISPECIES: DUF1254 domain-containing protein [unclassified Microcoleus]|uniref:DUF1254 domain-containing protein n=1 Tax=unclassified Microcoleus TaxID=2642155 RepID=UPI001D57B4A1|nr:MULTISPECIES: DUF1254 domain-containing protein [unclassified Microcoleus]MCC3507460.1 DUF1254 domain-containing protein [Microcoleus sp. PH2017_19_SFW_U_A]TAG86284.1 MAG: DUF1254 domain-containing protein [Oscillatoriales cyanobacterium]MCC3526362.1 DUF1254 domain-containing protein [Microcoleus sp. PH2017_20_SFW_D_A]MCC3557427.1 DUF1254 domain-containing protein [Microcoleus sp. PH2017_35_SFW_U_B]MCC3570022.1 DUF1254 domain-containing protein [Microcoleus sp. PH2017_31_RDM_U_A]
MVDFLNLTPEPDTFQIPAIGLPNGLLGVNGLGGNDTIQGSPMADRIFGNRGADRLFGQDGADTIRGGAGSDELAGGPGNDLLIGDRGNDWLRGGLGDDELQGGLGADVLIGGSGRDRLLGGPGADVFAIAPDATVLTVDRADRIVDFNSLAGDAIALTDGLTGDRLLVEASGNDTLLRLRDNNSILAVLEGVKPAEVGDRILPLAAALNNTEAGARNLTGESGETQVTGSLGSANRQDIYRLQLDRPTTVDLSLNGWQNAADVDLALLQDLNRDGDLGEDEAIASSEQTNSNSEAIRSLTLTPGQYFVRVKQQPATQITSNSILQQGDQPSATFPAATYQLTLNRRSASEADATAAKTQRDSEMQAFATGIKAYVYGYPLVLMATTQEVSTAVPAPDGAGRAPINEFAHVRQFPNPSFKDVVAPNVDTLYSTAWLDLTKEPIVLQRPDMTGRYYLMPTLDGWTNVFDSPGNRTTGTGAGAAAIVGPNWQGTLPSDLGEVRSPTNLAWIVGRTRVDGVADIPNATAIQDKYRLIPLSNWLSGNIPPAPATVPAPPGTTPPPPVQVADLSADSFYTKLNQLMKSNPPTAADAPLVASLEPFGLAPTQTFDFDALSFAATRGLERAVPAAQKIISTAASGESDAVEGWTISRGLGDYGTEYLKRAVVSLVGLGANLDADALYPTAYSDRDSQPLNGTNKYVLRFGPGEFPPSQAFWSVTMYDGDRLLVENSLNRYALGDRDPLKYNADGSLDIYIQNAPTDAALQSNWLPAPAGDFNLTMRIYWPEEAALNGTWTPPGIERTT